MAKKDFSKIAADPVYSTIAAATAEPETAETQEVQEAPKKQRKERRIPTQEEALQAMNALQTTGRKGVKLPRINLAFTPEVYEYIKIMAQVRGENLTQFVNHVLKKSMEDNKKIYDKAIEFRNAL